MQFSLYRNQLGAMLRKMVRIVLQYQERYNKAKFETYAADVSTDRLVENDLALISGAAGQVYRDILTPLQALGDGIPPESREQINVFMLQKVLEAMGAQDVQDIISIEDYERQPEAQEAGLAEEDVALTVEEERQAGMRLADSHLRALLKAAELTESHTGEKVSAQCPLCSFPESILYPDHAGLLVCGGCGKTWDPEIEGRRL